MSHPPSHWCSRRLLVTVEGPQGKSVIPLDRPFARIGRQGGSDIVLDSPWVSKRSVYLHATDEGIFCVYMQPEETGTQRMGYWIGSGEPLLVGPYRISASLEGDPPGPAPALTPLDEWGSALPPCPVFQVFSGGKLRDKRKFRARLNFIGRRHECALQIKGQQVSAFHGCLFWHLSRLWYVDLASSNGSTVNGAAVDVAELQVGDRIEAGEFTLLFQRVSQRGTHSFAMAAPAQSQPDALPARFDEDLPPDLDDDDDLGPGVTETQRADVAGSAPVIATTEPVRDLAHVPPSTQPTMPDEFAPVQQTQRELAVLQKQVEELTQLTAQAGQHAVQQLADQTREAFERERQRIAKELQQRAAELAREKQTLEAQWQSASRELTTQVNQLRDEAQQLALQRQAMEESRMLWDQQRAELEVQLRSYAEQLQRLEQGALQGLPAPGASRLPISLEVSTSRDHYPSRVEDTNAMVSRASDREGLVPRSHVVDSHVESDASRLDRSPRLLEGSLATELPSDVGPAASSNGGGTPKMLRDLPHTSVIKGRKATAKGGQAFDAVTDRIVERESAHRRLMLILGITVAVITVAVSAALVVTAVAWALNR